MGTPVPPTALTLKHTAPWSPEVQDSTQHDQRVWEASKLLALKAQQMRLGPAAFARRRRAASVRKPGEEWCKRPLGATPALSPLRNHHQSTVPLGQYFRCSFPYGPYPIDAICFLCVCPHYVAEKIELPNSTSMEVEMTPSSDASEPVQNGNLSHGIEAAEAQVRLLVMALLSCWGLFCL